MRTEDVHPQPGRQQARQADLQEEHAQQRVKTTRAYCNKSTQRKKERTEKQGFLRTGRRWRTQMAHTALRNAGGKVS